LSGQRSSQQRLYNRARAWDSLNHAHIGSIHGFEDADGITALVLEYVDGPTLAERIAAGPLPLDEALPIASQIADALDAAHEQGIVTHRSQSLSCGAEKIRADLRILPRF